MRKVRMTALALCVVLMLSVSAWGDVAVNATNFPDEVFREYVSSNFDTDSDDVLSDSEIASVTSIDVNKMGITTLEGVEYFTALTNLSCNADNIVSLDVSQNTALQTLYCQGSRNETTFTYNGKLASLNVSGCTELYSLECYYNQLTELDVSNNTALTRLDCYSNQLTELDLSNNTALTYLSCWGNQLTALDVSNNTALKTLDCGSNQLTELDVSTNTALT